MRSKSQDTERPLPKATTSHRKSAHGDGQKEKTQSQRFIEAAREAECSEDESVFDETLKRITEHKPKDAREPKK